MKTSILKKWLIAVMSFALVISALAFAPVMALAADGYNVSVKIKVLDDADGWNSANLRVYTDNDGNGLSEKDKKVKQWDIKSKIDDENEQGKWDFKCGKYFPTRVQVYTDFGGGFTARSWKAEVKIYINSVLVKSEQISAGSGVFSSSDKTNTVTLDKTLYPYPAKYSVAADKNITAYDQYGVEWGVLGKVADYGDNNSAFEITYKTSNIIYPEKTFSVETED